MDWNGPEWIGTPHYFTDKIQSQQRRWQLSIMYECLSLRPSSSSAILLEGISSPCPVKPKAGEILAQRISGPK